MNLGDLRTAFKSLLSRDDCMDTLATTFLIQGLQRMQRVLRVPSMERLVVYNSDPTTATTLSQIPIPNDFIQPIDILVMNDGSMPGYDTGAMVALEKQSFRQLQSVPAGYSPKAYARYQASFYFRGTVPATMETHLYYYGEFSPLADDTSENEIMASSPDLVTYAALSLAADYFQMPQASGWEDRYQQYLLEVTAMAIDIDANGGPSAIAPAYGDY